MKENWSKIKFGMSQDQVIDILGLPTSRNLIGGYQGTFYYEGHTSEAGVPVTGNISFDSNGQVLVISPPIW